MTASHHQTAIKAIMENAVLRTVFTAGPEVYLVGGYLRDLLRGLSSHDVDLVVRGGATSIVTAVISEFGGKVVQFKKGDFRLSRVFCGDSLLDFSDLRGTIEADLQKRDFTMNAIAWSPQSGLIDPYGGVADIGKQRIRIISEKNLVDDPLRLVRAYRFAGEMGWSLSPGTRNSIKRFILLAKEPSPERTTSEFLKILNAPFALQVVRRMASDGLLGAFLCFDSLRLASNLKVLSKFERFVKKLPEMYCFNFERVFSQNLSYRGLLRSEVLLYGVDLARSRLHLSKILRKRLSVVHELFRTHSEKGTQGRTELFELFWHAEEALCDVAVLSVKRSVLRYAREYSSMKPLVTGDDVMSSTEIREGREVGTLLKEAKRLQFLKILKKRSRALEWLQEAARRKKGLAGAC